MAPEIKNIHRIVLESKGDHPIYYFFSETDDSGSRIFVRKCKLCHFSHSLEAGSSHWRDVLMNHIEKKHPSEYRSLVHFLRSVNSQRIKERLRAIEQESLQLAIHFGRSCDHIIQDYLETIKIICGSIECFLMDLQ